MRHLDDTTRGASENRSTAGFRSGLWPLGVVRV